MVDEPRIVNVSYARCLRCEQESDPDEHGGIKRFRSEHVCPPCPWCGEERGEDSAMCSERYMHMEILGRG